jgi:hypothetical protein
MILRIISSTYGKGISIKELTEKTKTKLPSKGKLPNGLTRQTVSSLLKELISDGKVFKVKNKYYKEDLYRDDGWSIFGRYLGGLLRDKRFYGFPQDHISQMHLSDAFSNSDNAKESIFEFANLIGAFVAYLLIESMRPTRTLLPIPFRVEKAENFIETALNPAGLLTTFLSVLPDSYRKDVSLGVQMNEKSVNELSNAYKKIYPSFSEFIEEKYLEHFQNFYVHELEEYNYCQHKWKESFVHKIGVYYRCDNCQIMVKSSPPMSTDST